MHENRMRLDTWTLSSPKYSNDSHGRRQWTQTQKNIIGTDDTADVILTHIVIVIAFSLCILDKIRLALI
jgi:hypothetical protein